MDNESVYSGVIQNATLIRSAEDAEGVSPHGVYTFECFDKDGNFKWRDTIKNLVTTVGKNDLLDKYLAGSAYTATWYLGLISSVSYSDVAVGDTAASHAGWLEAGLANAPTYSQSARPAPAFAAASAGSKATSAAVAFNLTGTGTIKGSFLISSSTKDGTSGILYSAGLFSAGDKIVGSGDILNATYTATVA